MTHTEWAAPAENPDFFRRKFYPGRTGDLNGIFLVAHPTRHEPTAPQDNPWYWSVGPYDENWAWGTTDSLEHAKADAERWLYNLCRQVGSVLSPPVTPPINFNQ